MVSAFPRGRPALTRLATLEGRRPARGGDRHLCPVPVLAARLFTPPEDPSVQARPEKPRLIRRVVTTAAVVVLGAGAAIAGPGAIQSLRHEKDRDPTAISRVPADNPEMGL